MNKIETQIIVESTGNYDECDIEYIIETYDELIKNIGFEDNRHDKRFIVKFHDICYYTPYDNETEEEFWYLFDAFCEEQYMYIKDVEYEQEMGEDMMLTHYNCGHYPAFKVDIPKITQQNAAQLAMDIYDETGYRGPEYVRSYIALVDAMQDMEDNYMEYWIEFLRAGEYMPEETIKEIEDKYKSDKERRQ